MLPPHVCTSCPCFSCDSILRCTSPSARRGEYVRLVPINQLWFLFSSSGVGLRCFCPIKSFGAMKAHFFPASTSCRETCASSERHALLAAIQPWPSSLLFCLLEHCFNSHLACGMNPVRWASFRGKCGTMKAIFVTSFSNI
jgi:hypothetical protein